MANNFNFSPPALKGLFYHFTLKYAFYLVSSLDLKFHALWPLQKMAPGYFLKMVAVATADYQQTTIIIIIIIIIIVINIIIIIIVIGIIVIMVKIFF